MFIHKSISSLFYVNCLFLNNTVIQIENCITAKSKEQLYFNPHMDMEYQFNFRLQTEHILGDPTSN